MSINRLALVLVCGLAISCASTGPSAEVKGETRNLSALVGSWSGHYYAERQSQPAGTLAFTLAADADAARGTAVVTPRGAATPLVPFSTDDLTAASANASLRPMSIRFTRGSDGMIYGDIDPFWDKERNTEATTLFRGDVERDGEFAGTFRIAYANGAPQVIGEWKVTKATPDR